MKEWIAVVLRKSSATLTSTRADADDRKSAKVTLSPAFFTVSVFRDWYLASPVLNFL